MRRPLPSVAQSANYAASATTKRQRPAGRRRWKPKLAAASGGGAAAAETPIGLADGRYALVLVERLPQGAERLRRLARRR